MNKQGITMKNRARLVARWTNVFAVAAAMLSGAVAHAQAPAVGTDSDPPIRVGRVSYVSGQVSFSPAGNDEWVQAQLNRPVVTGDRLWADRDSRTELTVDNSTWWLGDQTSVTVSNLDDRIAQVQLQEGTLEVHVRRLPAGNIVEVDTPNLAFSLTRAGHYRIDVDPQEGSTTVVVRDGTGEVYGERASYVVTSRQAYRFYGTDVSDSEFVDAPPVDAFETFARQRDGRYDRVASARYVSAEVVGYEDLDRYGTWAPEPTYGSVWYPRSVRSGWAPYSDGHWAWIDPWGWTWVDDEPWGFAPFHYGRWAHFSRGWGWVPGPRVDRPVYAPALVAFVGGSGFSVSLSSGPAIGWFPLGPREVYVPPYRVSSNYFRQVNVTNTVVNVTNVTNIYNDPARLAQVNYVNRTAPNAVTAVPPAAFAQSQNVRRAAVAIPAAAIQRAEIHPVAPVAPARPALVGAAPVAQAKPPAAVMQRAVVAKAPPPPPPIPDAQKLQALEKNPGRPLDRSQLQALRSAAPPAAATAAAAPAVKLVEPAKPASNAAPPAKPAAAPGTRGQARGNESNPAARAEPPGQQRNAPAVATPPGPQRNAPAGAAPPGAQRNAPASGATPPGAERSAPAGGAAAPASPPSIFERANPPAAAPGARGPAERAAPEPLVRPPASNGAPAARPPETGSPAEPPSARARPQGPPGQAGRPQSRPAPTPAPEERAAPVPAPAPRVEPARPPEARSQPRLPEAGGRAPGRAPEAQPESPRPPPQARPEPPRPPEARPQPQARPEPPRPPEARPQARPEPPPRAAPPPPPPPKAEPAPPPAPRAAPAPPPQAQPRAPEARGAPPPADERGKGKGNDKKDKDPNS